MGLVQSPVVARARLSRVSLASARSQSMNRIVAAGSLGALNSEIIVNADGASTVSLDLRGTFNLTVEVSGSVHGVNWLVLPVRPVAGGAYLAAVAGTASGIWVAA